MDVEQIALRIHGSSDLPTLIYLPGLHGDWTLVASFRAAVKDRVRFVEFTYPRTVTWSLDDYATAVIDALLAHGIHGGWLLGESFSSQVAWKVAELSGAAEATKSFSPSGLIFAGGFVRYPILSGVRFVRMLNRAVPMSLLQRLLRVYGAYARFRHRGAPETYASINEFIGRRTENDRQAILHRYGLIISNDPRTFARNCRFPIYALSGFIDPIVPWALVLPWLRRNCATLRGSKMIWSADHNVLGTAPQASARTIIDWITPPSPEG